MWIEDLKFKWLTMCEDVTEWAQWPLSSCVRDVITVVSESSTLTFGERNGLGILGWIGGLPLFAVEQSGFGVSKFVLVIVDDCWLVMILGRKNGFA